MMKLAIIGAGLSGLSLATLLKGKADITVFDKARGVGGRMSTRRAEPYFFDHGAQYFTARTEAFKQFIEPYVRDGLIQRWDADYALLKGEEIVERRDWALFEPRYVAVPGMNSFAKHLAESVNVKVNAKVQPLEAGNKWRLLDKGGNDLGVFDWVVSTAPVPQTTELLPSSFKHHSDIQAIEMLPSFSLMLGFSKPISLPYEAAHVEESNVSWLAINNSKPERRGHTLLVHSSSDYASEHIDGDKETILRDLIAETSRITGCDVSAAEYKTLHGWRYANNVGRDQLGPFLDTEMQLAACGDWCVGGRVEGAFIAAHRLAEAIKSLL